jgi:hypothetical protein
VYCLDAQFSEEASKYVAGSLNALTAMVRDVLVVASFRAISHLDISFHVFCFLPRQVNIELPHVNVLTKLDLVRGRARQDGLIDWQDEDEDDERELIIPDRESLLRELNESYSHSKWLRLNEGIVSLLDEVRDTLRGLPGIRSYACLLVCLFACRCSSHSGGTLAHSAHSARCAPVELDWVCRAGSHERRFHLGGADES